ncbi:MAG: hypothetical protein PUP46_01475 [Endozoicomonas sp. (ex Botrylloides leachii)]|nr:hypothetical protein [Endozoicomonas sp. (ex Botrylloides leachii)]
MDGTNNDKLSVSVNDTATSNASSKKLRTYDNKHVTTLNLDQTAIPDYKQASPESFPPTTPLMQRKVHKLFVEADAPS